MKFKNDNQKFEWEVLELTESDYTKKLIILDPFNEKSDDLFSYVDGREKWNNTTAGKRFKKKILNTLNIIENKNEFEYSDIIEIYKVMSSISTHIYIELEYYDSNRTQVKEFFKVVDIFNNFYAELLKHFSEIIFDNKILNNYKKTLVMILEYFKDF